MEKSTVRETVKHLETIEKELREINDKTDNPKIAFLSGIWRGVGAVIGSIATVLFLGWLLHIFGLVPGLSEVAKYLEETVSNRDI